MQQPFYLNGSQTGGLLQNLNNQTASQTANTTYVPGTGMAPYADQGTGNMSVLSGAGAGATEATASNAAASMIQGLSGAQIETLNKVPGFWESLGGSSGGYNPVTKAPISAGASSGSLRASGGASGASSLGASQTPATTPSGGWMSPAELAAATNALHTSGVPSSRGGGGGGGGGSGGGSSSGTGIGTVTPGSTNPNSNSSPNFNQLQGINSTPITYQPPGTTGTGVLGNTNYQSPASTQAGYAAGEPGTLVMQQADPNAALASYQNTPGYQLLNTPGAYQASPGYQYAMDQAMLQTQQAASARGMLESGAVLRNMQTTASGLAQQDYGNWWNRQNQLYGDYQNRLAGLAGGSTGSADAMTTGQGIAANAQNTGNNLGTLFGNQANTGVGAYTNTGAAQANSMQQAANTQLQTNSANTSTLLAGAMLNKGSF